MKRIPPNQDGPTYPARPGKPTAAPPVTDEWNEFRSQLTAQGFTQSQIDSAIGNSIGSQSRRDIVRKIIQMI